MPVAMSTMQTRLNVYDADNAEGTGEGGREMEWLIIVAGVALLVLLQYFWNTYAERKQIPMRHQKKRGELFGVNPLSIPRDSSTAAKIDRIAEKMAEKDVRRAMIEGREERILEHIQDPFSQMIDRSREWKLYKQFTKEELEYLATSYRHFHGILREKYIVMRKKETGLLRTREDALEQMKRQSRAFDELQGRDQYSDDFARLDEIRRQEITSRKGRF